MTDCILIDIQGGELVGDRTKESPGMILVMDESGNLVMHDEVAESKEWEEATKEPERQEPRENRDTQRPRPRAGGPDATDIEIGPVRGGHRPK